MKYQEVTPKQLSNILIEKLEKKEIINMDFYTDYESSDIEDVNNRLTDSSAFSAAYGIKKVSIFDEDLLAIGYYSGGLTKIMDLTLGKEEIIDFVFEYCEEIEVNKVVLEDRERKIS